MKISVVIITKNRSNLLKLCLRSLTSQIRLPDEIVLVDNNSEEDIKKVVKSFNKRININYVLEKNEGTAFARNKGVRSSRYNLIAFIDSDCIADKNWLKNIEFCFRKYPKIKVMMGKTLCANPVNLITKTGQFLRKYYVTSQHLNPKNIFFQVKRYLFPNSFNKSYFILNFLTENLAIKKSVFKRVGLFDENIITTEEDSELSWRLKKNNIKVLFQPKIVVRHHHRESLKDFFIQYFLYGMGISNIKRKWTDFPTRIPNNLFNLLLFLFGFFVMPFFKIVQLKRLKDLVFLSPLILFNEFAFRFGIIYGMFKTK
ncbi:MAG: glycosyltransferase [Nanoarchaeota archaeon]|nr:glycosyltransferase [Nanoarchaeota archaeon]